MFGNSPNNNHQIQYMSDTPYPPIYDGPLLLTQAELVHPLSVLRAFYIDYDLPGARALLQDWCKAAFATRVLGRKKMLAVLELKEDLLRLLEAAHLLVDERTACLDLRHPIALMDPAHYCSGERDGLDAFAMFPRSLNRAEFMNPYRVFAKTRRRHTLPAWRECLQDLWSAGTTPATLYELAHSPAPWPDTRTLFKLVDASHLVVVRESQLP
jgi:hypothetical protein